MPAIRVYEQNLRGVLDQQVNERWMEFERLLDELTDLECKGLGIEGNKTLPVTSSGNCTLYVLNPEYRNCYVVSYRPNRRVMLIAPSERKLRQLIRELGIPGNPVFGHYAELMGPLE